MLKFSVLYFDGLKRRYVSGLSYDELTGLVIELSAYGGEILHLDCYIDLEEDDANVKN